MYLIIHVILMWIISENAIRHLWILMSGLIGEDRSEI